MPPITFAAGDKDYVQKLNQMSQNAGDTAQLKADTEQLKQDVQGIKDATETIRQETDTIKQQTAQIRDNTEAIAAGDLVFKEISEDRAVKHGDLLLVTAPSVELSLADFKEALAVGQWFTVENASSGLVYVATLEGLSIVGRKGSVSNGDRFAISPDKSFTFRAISTTELKVR